MNAQTAIEQGGFPLHPSVHKLVYGDIPWLNACREATGRDLFLYHHQQHNTFVLCDWMVKPRTYGEGIAVCTEIVAFSDHPNRGPKDLPEVERVARMCRPAHENARAMRREMAQQHYEEARIQEDENREVGSVARFLRSRRLDEAADRIEHGIEPFIGQEAGGEQLRELTEDMQRMARDSRTVDMGKNSA